MNALKKRLFQYSLAQDGIYSLGKAIRALPRHSEVPPNAAFETVPTFKGADVTWSEAQL